MAINFDDAFTKNYMDSMYPQPPEEPAQDTMLAAGPVTSDAPQAFVGTRLNVPKAGQAQPTTQDRQRLGIQLFDALAAMPKGAVQATVGLPGDLESIGRTVLDYFGYNVNQETALPTSEDISKKLESTFGPVVPKGQTTIVPTAERERAAKSGETIGEFLPAPGIPDAVIKGGRLVGRVVMATKDMPIGMSIKLIDGTDATVKQAPKIETQQFKNWFGNSKVVDESNQPIIVYHGTGRPDRVGTQFRKSRATSGPMAFFTDSPEIAGSYAKGKTDTSIAYEDNAYDYVNWFKKKEGRSTLNLEQVGARMNQAERQSAIEKLKDIRMTDDGDIIYEKGGGSIMNSKSFDYYLNTESKGNPLIAANKIFLESGTLYNQEEKFAKVLNLMGLKGFDMTSPHERMPAVYPVYLSIKNPLDTSAIPSNVVSALESASTKVRKPTQRGGADNWDKNTVSPKDWVDRLKSDIETGTTHAWTSIPDWVTKTLKAQGYDGIKDMGGKGGGTPHSVWIPFEENQIKSATGNIGTFDPKSKNILKGVAVGGGGGAAVQQEENQ